jgi:hypothetical protein
MEIEVAPLLRTTSAFKGPRKILGRCGPDVPWEQRPKTVISLKPETTIGEIVDRAAHALKLKLKKNQDYERSARDIQTRVLFHSVDGGSPFVSLDVILNSDGSARWRFDPMRVTVAELEEARAAGLLLGDSARMYIVLDEPPPGLGNGVDYWLSVMQSMPYLEAFLTIHGAISAVTGTVMGFRKLVEKVRDRWGDTGGTIKNYDRLFQIPRTTRQIVTLLRMDEEDVPTIAHFFGLEQSADGYWRPHNRPERKELRELAAVIDTVGHWHLSNKQRSEALDRILGFRPGERAKHADPIVRQIIFEAHERGEY